MISVAFGLIYGQTENIFSLTEFTMPTKHVIFRKMISEFRFQPKQTDPKVNVDVTCLKDGKTIVIVASYNHMEKNICIEI